jgi:hypothetical protein
VTPQQIVGLAARLFSIWLAITAFQSLGIAEALKASEARGPVWVPYLFVLLYLGAALVLWFFPMAIAHKLVPRTKFEDKLRVPATQAVVVACVVLGLMVIVVRALPPISAYVSLAVFWIGSGLTLSSMEASRHIDALVGVVQFVAGVLLVTKAHAVAGRIMDTPVEVSDDRATALSQVSRSK